MVSGAMRGVRVLTSTKRRLVKMAVLQAKTAEREIAATCDRDIAIEVAGVATPPGTRGYAYRVIRAVARKVAGNGKGR